MSNHRSLSQSRHRAAVRKLAIERLEVRLPLNADFPIGSGIPEETSIADFVDSASLEEIRAAGLTILEAIDNGSLTAEQLTQRLAELLPPRETPETPPVEQTTPTSTSGGRTFGQFPSAVVQVRLDAPSDPLVEGSEFVLELIAQTTEAFQESLRFDLTAPIFQVMVDLHFDPAVVEPIPDGLVVADGYNVLGGPQFEDGVIRDFGALSKVIPLETARQTIDSTAELRIASIPFRVIGPGEAAFTAEPAHEEAVLLFGYGEPVPVDQIDFAPLPLLVPPDTDDSTLDSVPLTLDPTPVPPLLVFPPSLFRQSFFTFLYLESDSDPLDEIWGAIDGIWQFGEEDDDDSSSVDPLEQQSESTDELAEPRNATDKAEEDSQQSDTDDGDESETSRFWKEFDLQLLDEQAAVSMLRLHLRALRLKLAEDECSRQTGDSDAAWRHRERVAQRESVIDLGLADVSLWLFDPAYWSWRETGNQQPHRDTTETAVYAEDNQLTERRSSENPWAPTGKIAHLNRLDLVEEMPQDAVIANAWRSADAGINMNIAIPASDSEGDAAPSE